MGQGSGKVGPVRISSRQFFYIILSLGLGLPLVAVPPLLIRDARQGLWLSMLLAVAANVAVAAMLYSLGRRYPGKTLFEYSQIVLGSGPGRIVAGAYAAFFLHTAALAVRTYSDMFLLSLPETPPQVLVGLLCLVVTFGASRGFEAMGRAAELLAPLAVFSVVVALALLTTRADPGYLRPALPRPGAAVYAGLLPAAWLGNGAVMGVLMAYHNEPVKAFRVKVSAVLMGSTLITGIMLCAVVVLGPELAARQLIPIVTAVRGIEVAQLVERPDSLFQVIVVAAGTVSTTALLAAAALGAAQVAGTPDWRPLTWPLGIVMGWLALAAPSSAAVARFLAGAFPLYGLTIVAGLTALLLLVSLPRPPWRGGRARPRGPGRRGRAGRCGSSPGTGRPGARTRQRPPGT